MADKEEVIEVKAAESSPDIDDSGKKKIIVVVVAVVVIIAIIGFFLLTGEEEPSNGNGDGENRPPAAAFTHTPPEVYANDTVNFDAATTVDPDEDDVLTYDWNFDDDYAEPGNPNEDSGITASHIFTMPGVYNVNLTVDDGDKTGTANETITVMPEETPTVSFVQFKPDNSITNIIWTLTVDSTDGSGEQFALDKIFYYFYNGTNTDEVKLTGSVSSLEPALTPPQHNEDGIYLNDNSDSIISTGDTFSIAGDGGAGIQAGDSFQLIYRPPYMNEGVPMCDLEVLT